MLKSYETMKAEEIRKFSEPEYEGERKEMRGRRNDWRIPDIWYLKANDNRRYQYSALNFDTDANDTILTLLISQSLKWKY